MAFRTVIASVGSRSARVGRAVKIDLVQNPYCGVQCVVSDWTAVLRRLLDGTFGCLLHTAYQPVETFQARFDLPSGIPDVHEFRLGLPWTLGQLDGLGMDIGQPAVSLGKVYAGRLQAMPAMYTSNDERFRIIRPLIEASEAEIIEHARATGYPIIPCNLCGSQDSLKRIEMKRLLEKLEGDVPHLRTVMMSALKNVRPSHLLDAEVAEAWIASADNYSPRR